MRFKFKDDFKPIFLDFMAEDLYPEFEKNYKSIKCYDDLRDQYYKNLLRTFINGQEFFRQEQTGAAHFFNIKLGLPVFTIPGSNNIYFPFTYDRKKYGNKYLTTHKANPSTRGIAVLTGKTNKGKNLVVIDIEGIERDKLLDIVLDKLNIQDNSVIDDTGVSYHVYFYSNYSGNNTSIEFSNLINARITVLSNGGAIYPAPHARYTALIKQEKVREGVFLNGNQVSWWDINDLPVTNKLEECLIELKNDTIRYKIPNTVYKPYKADIYIHRAVYKYILSYINKTGNFYKVIKSINSIMGENIIQKIRKFYQVNALSKIQKEVGIWGTDLINVIDFPNKPPLLTSIKNERMTVVFDLINALSVSFENNNLENILNSIKLSTMKTLKEYNENIVDVDAFNSMFLLKYTKHFTYKNYMSEHKDEILRMYEWMADKLLVVAPTGAGKTKAFLETALENNIKVIYAVPYTSQVEQLSKKYNIIGVKAGVEVDYNKLTNVIVCTYDQISNIVTHIHTEEWSLVIDEVHNLIQSTDFRPVVRYILNYAPMKNIIGITATPETAVDTDIWKLVYKFEPENKKDLFNNVNVVKVEKELLNTFVKEYKNIGYEKGKIDVVFINDTRQINKLEEVFKLQGLRVGTIYSYIKNTSESYKTIIEKEQLPDVDILLSTSVIADGVNIINENIGNVYLLGEYNGIVIRQFIARFRNGFNNLYHFIVKNDKLENSILPYFTDLVNTKAVTKQGFIQLYNMYINKTGVFENAQSSLDVKGKIEEELHDSSVVKDEDGYYLDKSLILKEAQNEFYSILFHKNDYIRLFYECFYDKAPNFNYSKKSKQPKSVGLAKKVIDSVKDSFEIVLKEKPEEVAASYIKIIKPDWTLNLDEIKTDNTSTSVDKLMEVASKYKFVSNSILNLLRFVESGMSYDVAASLTLKDNKSKSKISKQLYYMALFNALDLYELKNSTHLLTNFTDRFLLLFKRFIEYSGIVHYQTFEAIIEAFKDSLSEADQELFDGSINLNFVRTLFRNLYTFKQFRPAAKRYVVNFEGDKIVYNLVYDKARRISYKDVRRLTIDDIVSNFELSEEQEKELKAALEIQYNAYYQQILVYTLMNGWEEAARQYLATDEAKQYSVTMKNVWRYLPHKDNQIIAQIYNLVIDEFGVVLEKYYSDINYWIQKVDYTDDDIYLESTDIFGKRLSIGSLVKNAIQFYKDIKEDIKYFLHSRTVLVSNVIKEIQKTLKAGVYVESFVL